MLMLPENLKMMKIHLLMVTLLRLPSQRSRTATEILHMKGNPSMNCLQSWLFNTFAGNQYIHI